MASPSQDPKDVTQAARRAPAYLQRPEGRVAYEVAGDGPLVVCAGHG